MVIERIKNMGLKNLFLKVLLPAFLLVLLIFYLKAFFTVGAYFNNTFLVKDVVASEKHYMGKCEYGGIHITVKGLEDKDDSAEVIYRLPNNINKQYTVNFKDADNWESGIESIKDEAGNIVFEGEYQKGSKMMFDKDGKPLINEYIRIISQIETTYSADYKVPLKNVADFAFSENDTIRGESKYMVLAIFIFLITFIDIKYPLFFFTLRHCVDVKDPEPSDFYITMQRIGWVVYPIIGVILMIDAIY